MNPARRSLALTACLLVFVGYMLTAARAAESAGEPTVRIREAVLSPNGDVRLVVSVGGIGDRVLDRAAFSVTEAGRSVKSPSVTPLLRSRTQPVTVALVFDASGSTAGRPITDAKAAGKRFLSLLPPDVRVMVVSFGPRASLRQGLTSNRAALARAIDGVNAGGGTALYDAVVLAAQRLGAASGQHNMVLFSDGRDTASTLSLARAISAARAASAPVTSVGLVTKDIDRSALSALARETGGQSVEVGASARLADAFGRVAQEIASQYVLTYHSTALAPKELELRVAVTANGAAVADRVAVLNPRVAGGVAAEPPVVGPAQPPVRAFAGRAGLYVGVGAVFVALAMFLGVLLLRPSDAGVRRVLRGLGQRTGRKSAPVLTGDDRSGIAATALGRRAAELIDRVPKQERFEQRMQLRLDRAGWPLRTSEFVVIQVLAVAGGALLGFVLVGRWYAGVALILAGVLAPRVVLRRKIDKRRTAFLGQLPDTLQLLAGSLQAGYGFMQGLDTLVREAQAPTSTEFNRVLSEVRLGMPVEDAMSQVADRVDSDDFRWVVLAINIQRQVGGNLAVLLQTVSQTLREREQVRRQIRVLSAEGRLSASILTVLPFLLAGYIAVVNPSYISALYIEPAGRIMIVGALVMMALGIGWMRKIIKIDV